MIVEERPVSMGGSTVGMRTSLRPKSGVWINGWGSSTMEEKTHSRPPLKPNQYEQVTHQLITSLKASRSSEELKTACNNLSQHVTKEIRHTKSRISDQLAFLRSERDSALDKQKSGEIQVKRLKRELDVLQTEYKLVDKARIKNLQTQLQAAIVEKEALEEKVEKLDDAIETMQLVNSLQKSMSKEDEIKQKYSARIQQLEEGMEEQRKQIIILSAELDQVTQQHTSAISKRKALMEQLLQEREKSQRLQNLVEVLRSKALSSDVQTEHVLKLPNKK